MTPRCGGGEPVRAPASAENPARARRWPCLRVCPTAPTRVRSSSPHRAAHTTDPLPRTTHRMTTRRRSRRVLVARCRAGLGATGWCRVGHRVGRAPKRSASSAAPTNPRCSDQGRRRRARDRCFWVTRGRHRCSRSVVAGAPTSGANEAGPTVRHHGWGPDGSAATRRPTSGPRSAATSHRDRPGPRTRPVRRHAPDRPRHHRRRPPDGSYPQARHAVPSLGLVPF